MFKINKMKLIIASIFFAVLMISCENKKEEQTILTNDFTEKESEVLQPTAHCYLFTNGKDSIRLSYTQENDEIDGWMNYDFFEKDGSTGEVDGRFFGDTLKLEYEFMSEGMISEQQVYFLKKDGKLYRGAGNMKSDNDSMMVYSNPKQIKFDDTTPLSHLDNCPENFINKESMDFYKKESERMD